MKPKGMGVNTARVNARINIAGKLAVFCVVLVLSVKAAGAQPPPGPNWPPFPGFPGFPVPGPGSPLDAGAAMARDAMSLMERAMEDPEPTPEDAYFLGRAVAARILSIYRPYTCNPALTAYLNRICQALVINSPQPVAFRGYSVMILDTPEFNAFASPGGHIFLTRGLIEAANSEDMLAAVIAHELAHIMLGHGMQLIANMSMTDLATATADRAAALAGRNNPGAQRLMQYRNAVSGMMDTMLRSGFSQSKEFEADRMAVSLLASAGYNPAALLEILEILQRVQPSQSGGFNSTHPTPQQRINNIRETVRRYSRAVPNTSAYRRERFINNR